MNLEQIETFLVLSQIGNFTKAAEILNVTQPAVTARINNLEAELQTELFILRGRKISLTETGQTFLPYAQNILNQFLEVKSKINQIQNPVVVVGFPPSFANTFISRFFALSKGVNVIPSIYRGVDSNDLVNQIYKGAITMALIHGGFAGANLHLEKVAHVNFMILLGHHHPLAQRPKLTKEQLENETLICYKRNTKLWLQIERELQGCRLQFIEVNDIDTVKTLVRNGFGLTVLPEMSIDEHDLSSFRMVPFQPANPWDTDLHIVYQEKLSNTTAIFDQLKLVAQLLRSSLSVAADKPDLVEK